MKVEAPFTFLRLSEVMQMTGCSRSMLYKLIKQGDFPKQVQLSERTVAWRSDQVFGWIKSKGGSNE